MIFDHKQFDAHEGVYFVFDRETGLRAIIAVHNTRLGPGFGGCRAYAYASEEEALKDVLRLSKGMSYKNAAAGVPYGGAKSVIITQPGTTPSVAQRLAFAAAVEKLQGCYLTAEDVGTSTADVATMARVTRFIRNLPLDETGRPAPFTARGVFAGMKAGWRHVTGSSSLNGITVAIEGLGAVGMELARLVKEAGGRVMACDVDESLVAMAVEDFGLVPLSVGQAHAADADIYAPCALGGTINANTIPEIRAMLIAGGANNQLAEPEDGVRLMDRDIVYCPDFVINAGGVLSVAPAGEAFDPIAAFARAETIGDRMAMVLRNSSEWNIAPHEAAERIARNIIAAGGDQLQSAAE